MSSKGGYTAAPPRQGGDRFYNPPMVRRHQHVLQQQLMQRQLHQHQQQQQHHQQQQEQQHQLQKRGAFKAGSSSSAEAEKQSDADDSSMAVALSVRHSVSPATTVEITNLDRLMESVTPFIEARYLTEVYMRNKFVSFVFYFYFIFFIRLLGDKTLNNSFSFAYDDETACRKWDGKLLHPIN